MNPVRVGVIGIGNMGWHHARVLSLIKDAELVGVADPDGARGELATEQFGCHWFADYEQLLPGVDAVCIAVPTLMHHRVGLACLQAGKHVLIEKPIAASQEEAAELISAADRAGVLLQVGHAAQGGGGRGGGGAGGPSPQPEPRPGQRCVGGA